MLVLEKEKPEIVDDFPVKQRRLLRRSVRQYRGWAEHVYRKPLRRQQLAMGGLVQIQLFTDRQDTAARPREKHQLPHLRTGQDGDRHPDAAETFRQDRHCRF